jgi:hypothetical protein
MRQNWSLGGKNIFIKVQSAAGTWHSEYCCWHACPMHPKRSLLQPPVMQSLHISDLLSMIWPHSRVRIPNCLSPSINWKRKEEVPKYYLIEVVLHCQSRFDCKWKVVLATTFPMLFTIITSRPWVDTYMSSRPLTKFGEFHMESHGQ